jgi:hypothetical protein
MKKKFIIGAIFTVLLMISISTIAVINAQTENAENTTFFEEKIDEKESKNCQLCSVYYKAASEKLDHMLQFYDKENIDEEKTSNFDIQYLGWYPFKIIICSVLAIAFLVMPYPAAWGPYVTARTIFGCLWAQGPLP